MKTSSSFQEGNVTQLTSFECVQEYLARVNHSMNKKWSGSLVFFKIRCNRRIFSFLCFSLSDNHSLTFISPTFLISLFLFYYLNLFSSRNPNISHHLLLTKLSTPKKKKKNNEIDYETPMNWRKLCSNFFNAKSIMARNIGVSRKRRVYASVEFMPNSEWLFKHFRVKCTEDKSKKIGWPWQTQYKKVDEWNPGACVMLTFLFTFHT